jgi:nucleoside-diphosphate-sugar epimerase
VRDPARALSCVANGVEVVTADIFDGISLRAGLAGCDTAINLATSLPSPAKASGDFDLNDRLRREGVPIFLEACQRAGVDRVVQQSIAMVHCGGGDAWADETTVHEIDISPVAGRAIVAARAMELAVSASSLDWLILRGALFYGPGTGFDEDWFVRAKAGKLRCAGDGYDYVSLIHIADMADATVRALSSSASRQALIIADDSPVRWKELFGHVATLAGGSPPEVGGPPRFPSFRLSNRRAKEALAWSPRYPNFAVGLAR